jgi:hypothetical protein
VITGFVAGSILKREDLLSHDLIETMDRDRPVPRHILELGIRSLAARKLFDRKDKSLCNRDVDLDHVWCGERTAGSGE